MRLYDIQEISDTVDFLYEITSSGRVNTYEELLDALLSVDEREYTVDITINEDEDFFDVDIGKMAFIIYKTEDGGFRINKNATYYTYDTGSSIDCTIIDIEL